MTDRRTASTITDTDLDQLYAEVDRLTAELDDYDNRVEQLTTELDTLRAVSALAAATPASDPREHCGHLSPETGLSTVRTECVLRPGHSGSHADEVGCRWWSTNQEQTGA